MKVRSDFVTNSSSSSFILAFKDEDTIYKTLEEQFPQVENGWSAGEDGYLSQLYREICEAHLLTHNEVKEIVEEEDDTISEFSYYLKKKYGMPYDKERNFVFSDKGRREFEKFKRERVKSILESIGDSQIIVEVEHGSGGDGEDGVLEHEILPRLDCTVARFSHH